MTASTNIKVATFPSSFLGLFFLCITFSSLISSSKNNLNLNHINIMKFTTAAATAALASLSVAAPTALTKRAAITDADVLNYALTLEHLEATFYAQALQNYTQGESQFYLPSLYIDDNV